jgi:hypothetical protein
MQIGGQTFGQSDLSNRLHDIAYLSNRLHDIALNWNNHEDVVIVHEALGLIDQISKDQIASFPRKPLITLCEKLLKSSTFLQPSFQSSFLSSQFSKIISSINLSSLTPLQPLFLSACYNAGNYELAKKVALSPIYTAEFAKETGLTAAHAQAHFYYSGLVLVRLKSWLHASESFRYCLQVPAEVVTQMAADSFRFFIYTGVLASGLSPHPPRTVSSVLRDVDRGENEQRVVKLASACSTNGPLDVNLINQIVNEGGVHGLWKPVEDGVFHPDSFLMYELVSAASCHRILRLSDIYSKVPLTEVSKAIGQGANENTADVVETLIKENRLPAGTFLDRAAAMLSFKQETMADHQSIINDDVINANAAVTSLYDEVKDVLGALSNLKAFDADLSSHPVLQQLRREKRDSDI